MLSGCCGIGTWEPQIPPKLTQNGLEVQKDRTGPPESPFPQGLLAAPGSP